MGILRQIVAAALLSACGASGLPIDAPTTDAEECDPMSHVCDFYRQQSFQADITAGFVAMSAVPAFAPQVGHLYGFDAIENHPLSIIQLGELPAGSWHLEMTYGADLTFTAGTTNLWPGYQLVIASTTYPESGNSGSSNAYPSPALDHYKIGFEGTYSKPFTVTVNLFGNCLFTAAPAHVSGVVWVNLVARGWAKEPRP